jgi:release factor glutamine methyltransferase
MGLHNSVSRSLADARARLIEAGFEPADAKREAEELYSAIVLGPTHRAWLDQEQAISPVVAGRLRDAAEKRAAGWPQQYAAGRANFRGHWLAVDHRVLIPRPETEGLVDIVIKEVGEWESGRVGEKRRSTLPHSRTPTLPLVADIGTGSGAIAIALALEAPIAGVIATDISADALNLAVENAVATGAKERISFRKGPLCLPLLGDVVDAIVSNPPYVSSSEWAGLEPHVKDYEPRLALDGGDDGLDVIRGLVADAIGSLSPGGLLALETDSSRAEQTAVLARQAGFERVEVRNDLFGRPRHVVGRRPEH